MRILVNKFLRCQNCSWHPKVTLIFELKNLCYMDLANLFEKMEEHEMELKRLVEDEEGDKKKKNLAIKVKEGKDSYTNEDMPLLV